MITLDERCILWRQLDERFEDLWSDLIWVNPDGGCRCYDMPESDIDAPIMDQLVKMTEKMRELVKERLELAEKTYSAVKDKEDELRKMFNLDEDDYPDNIIDYKTLLQAI